MATGKDLIEAIRKFGLDHREIDEDTEIRFPLSQKELHEKDKYGENLMEYTDFVLLYDPVAKSFLPSIDVWKG